MKWECAVQFGDPRLPLSFWRERYEDENGCWLRSDGSFTVGTIYRFVYEILVGDIPEGYVLDHLCRQREACSNPDHLEPVTSAENGRRNTPYRKRPKSQSRTEFRRWQRHYFRKPKDAVNILPGEIREIYRQSVLL